MPDVGYRSVEITVLNSTKADLSITGATTSGANVSWISEEQPKEKEQLGSSQSAVWGVMTDDVDGSAIGTVVLTGLGEDPVSIHMQNLSNGQSQATVQANDKVQGLVAPIPTGEQNHSAFQVTLMAITSVPKLGKR
ncbi:MAG: hypothetical protein IRZ16_20070 [Myxococcaceae bacterium]|nr:hypothetical protein [Myxococcaceae bacterium]